MYWIVTIHDNEDSCMALFDNYEKCYEFIQKWKEERIDLSVATTIENCNYSINQISSMNMPFEEWLRKEYLGED